MDLYIFSKPLLDVLKNREMKSLAHLTHKDYSADKYVWPDVSFLYKVSSKEVPLIGKEIDGELYFSIHSNEAEIIAANDIPLVLNLLEADEDLSKYLEQAGFKGVIKKKPG